MHRRTYPTQADIKKVVDYDPETGIFTWRERDLSYWKPGRHQQMNCITWNAQYKGKPAGCITDRYVRVTINKRPFQAHRLAWIYMNGDEPFGDMDHINTNKGDNKYSNLRISTRPQNMHNYLLCKSNTSGVRGLSWNKGLLRWEVDIKVDGKNIHLGIYENFKDAVQSRYDAEVKYGFIEFNPESSAYKYLQEAQNA